MSEPIDIEAILAKRAERAVEEEKVRTVAIQTSDQIKARIRKAIIAEAERALRKLDADITQAE